jgi:hypothetical protein
VRRLFPLLLAVGAFAGFGVLWILTDTRAPQRIYDTYSTLNTSPEGLSLASSYLARKTRVRTLTRTISRQPLEANAVLFRVVEALPTLFDPEDLAPGQMGPPRPKTLPLLTDAEDAFVRGGGRVVIATTSGALDTYTLKAATAEKVFPIWPQLSTLNLPTPRGFASLSPRMLPLFVADTGVVVARERHGKGDLILLAVPEVLRNDQLPKNLELLTALAGAKRPVYFDEQPHGIVSEDGILPMLREWNLGPFLLLLGVLASLIFWRSGKRVGPAEDEHRETRSDAVDLVRSLGALYESVTPDAAALTLYHEALTRSVASQTGLRGDLLRKRVDDLTGGVVPPTGTGPMPAALFQKLLAQLNRGFETLQSRRE